MTDLSILSAIEERLTYYGNRGGINDTCKEFLEHITCFGADLKSHVCRVALIAERVALETGSDGRAAFYAGLLHDFGKVLLPEQLFDGHDIDLREYEHIKSHAERGFRILREHHLFSALVAGLHHALGGENTYGITSDDLPEGISEKLLQNAVEMAQLISMVDFADAFLHRRTRLIGETGESHTPEVLVRHLKDRFGPRAPIDAVIRHARELKDRAAPRIGCDNPVRNGE
jgi:putative nucleotidyltransferase with HDIG domain